MANGSTRSRDASRCTFFPSQESYLNRIRLRCNDCIGECLVWVIFVRFRDIQFVNFAFTIHNHTLYSLLLLSLIDILSLWFHILVAPFYITLFLYRLTSSFYRIWRMSWSTLLVRMLMKDALLSSLLSCLLKAMACSVSVRAFRWSGCSLLHPTWEWDLCGIPNSDRQSSESCINSYVLDPRIFRFLTILPAILIEMEFIIPSYRELISSRVLLISLPSWSRSLLQIPLQGISYSQICCVIFDMQSMLQICFI